LVSEFDVLILGGSFAGIEVAYQLARYGEGVPPSIAVVDRLAEHAYIPLVHERLCRRLASQPCVLETGAYIRSLPGAEFVQDEIVGFDPATLEVEVASGARLRGRTVVVALGSVAEPPRSLAGAELIHTYKFEAGFRRTAAALGDVLTREGGEPSIAVVGGGVSGVELAGELADLRRMRPDGWRIPRVTLVDGGARLLSHMPERVGARALAALTDQGVDVRLRCRVRAAHPEGLSLLESGRADAQEPVELPADLVVWAAGIRPAPILAVMGLPRTSEGWLEVGPTLQSFPSEGPPRSAIFACGDAVRVVGGKGPWPTMQRAIECIWQAKVVARNVLATLQTRREDGPPRMRPHRLRRTFFYGVSLGRESLVVYDRSYVNVRGVNHEFRRWLMRRYFARYAPRPLPLLGPPT